MSSGASQASEMRQREVFSLDAECLPPPDLTQKLVKIEDRYVAGGAFGDVYRCWYEGGSKPQEVAVKALRIRFVENTGNQSDQMLRRELGIWRRLSHDNIIPFLGIAHGFGMCDAISLVSLWMPNESLHKFLETHNDKLNTNHRLQILLDIARGLRYLHSFPIVHGDLYPNNVLLDADYTARLADFGYASLVGNCPESLAYLQRSTARPGALRWVAPELFDPEGTFHLSTECDIYSFGCIALQVLSGKQPWSEVRTEMAVIGLLTRGQNPGRPESLKMDDSLWGFIRHCWSSPQDRPAADKLIAFLEQFIRGCPQSGPLLDLFISPAHDADSPVGQSCLSLPTKSTPENSRRNSEKHDETFSAYSTVLSLTPSPPKRSFLHWHPSSRSPSHHNPHNTYFPYQGQLHFEDLQQPIAQAQLLHHDLSHPVYGRGSKLAAATAYQHNPFEPDPPSPTIDSYESPFSFHPPALTGSATYGGSTQPSPNSPRKRPFSGVDGPQDEGSRREPNSGLPGSSEYEYGTESRPQSRRLTVRELCNDTDATQPGLRGSGEYEYGTESRPQSRRLTVRELCNDANAAQPDLSGSDECGTESRPQSRRLTVRELCNDADADRGVGSFSPSATGSTSRPTTSSGLVASTSALALVDRTPVTSHALLPGTQSAAAGATSPAGTFGGGIISPALQWDTSSTSATSVAAAQFLAAH